MKVAQHPGVMRFGGGFQQFAPDRDIFGTRGFRGFGVAKR